MKKRADLILVEKNLAENKSKAKAMIMAGQVSIDGKIVKKSGERFDENLIISTSSLISCGMQIRDSSFFTREIFGRLLKKSRGININRLLIYRHNFRR